MPKAKNGKKNNRRAVKDEVKVQKLILATAVINVLNGVVNLIRAIIDYIK